MSALVNEAIEMCKAEEAKLTEAIRQFKGILRSLKTPVNISSETDPPVDGAAEPEDIPLKEQQEIELLEQVLRKALKVRSSSSVSRELSADLQEKKSSKISRQSKASIKNTTTEKTQKALSSTELQGRYLQQGGRGAGGTVLESVKTRHVLVMKGPQSQKPTRGKLPATKPAPVQVSESDSQDAYRDKKNGRGSSENREFKRNQVSPLKEQWVLSPAFHVWRTQRAKKNSLWIKVLSQQSRLVPEQVQFKERLSSTFPQEWPSGGAASGGTELNSLVQLGLDLIHCYHAELQCRQPLSACNALGKAPETLMERDYESLLMLEGLEGMMTQVITQTNHLKKEWERKVGGALCSLQKRSERGDPRHSVLPPLLFYTTETELEELESLRLRVSQLQLEIRLHQVLSDAGICYLTSQKSTSGCPSATELRGLYSLLGEGGMTFPALVLDSDPDQT
ncbi:tubulin epsilon and delta complex protein 2 [Hoplias malabaricus]|uniref:tubulin epsilon and delta complex protein 2 n=1 Tax=Hoplias malabaricus TaxID=27720 RepID=UPI003461CF33